MKKKLLLGIMTLAMSLCLVPALALANPMEKPTTVCIEAYEVDSGALILDASFSCEADGSEVKTLQSGDIVKLKDGTYEIVVNEAPGHALPESGTFTIKDGVISSSDFSVFGSYVSVELKVTKIDIEVTPADVSAHLQILNENNYIVKEWDSDSVTNIYAVERLDTNHTYTLRVSSVPDGYAYPEDVTFVINPDGTLSEDTTANVRTEDGAILVTIKEATDSEDNPTDNNGGSTTPPVDNDSNADTNNNDTANDKEEVKDKAETESTILPKTGDTFGVAALIALIVSVLAGSALAFAARKA